MDTKPRRTIMNLSRELKVSRPKIYRVLDKLGFARKAGEEYPLDEYERLKKELLATSSNNKQTKIDAEKIKSASVKANEKTKENEQIKPENTVKIETSEKSTLKERLDYAKQEYDYNRELILMFQEETRVYFELHHSTTILLQNGAASTIPSITNLEKYIKLNIALSKLISDLEGDLDLSEDGGDNPFG